MPPLDLLVSLELLAADADLARSSRALGARAQALRSAISRRGGPPEVQDAAAKLDDAARALRAARRALRPLRDRGRIALDP